MKVTIIYVGHDG